MVTIVHHSMVIPLVEVRTQSRSIAHLMSIVVPLDTVQRMDLALSAKILIQLMKECLMDTTRMIGHYVTLTQVTI